MHGTFVQTAQRVQKVQRMQGRDAGFMNAGPRDAVSTEGAESAGCRVQRCGSHECRGSETAELMGAESERV